MIMAIALVQCMRRTGQGCNRRASIGRGESGGGIGPRTSPWILPDEPTEAFVVISLLLPLPVLLPLLLVKCNASVRMNAGPDQCEGWAKPMWMISLTSISRPVPL